MATSQSGSISSNTSAVVQSSQSLSTTFTGNPSKSFTRTYNAADLGVTPFFNTYTITTGGTTLDLTALTDVWGNALSFTTVKHLEIVNNDPTNSLTVGGGTNPLFAALPPLAGQAASGGGGSVGSCLQFTTPLTVSGSTKNLKLIAGAGSITVDVFILGS